MNYIHLLGSLKKDPSMNISSNTCFVNFDISVVESHKKMNGEINKKECVIPCVAWDSGAKLINKFFKKDSKIIVHGKISYEDGFFVRVKSFEFA